MWTVPHSGTRYTKTAFEREGLRCIHAYRRNAMEKYDAQLVWGHIDHDKQGRYLYQAATEAKHEILIVRNPIDVWATWVVPHLDKDDADERIDSSLSTLEAHWRGQVALIDEHDPYIHRVDMDTLESLGEHVGIPLVTHQRRYTQGMYPLKAAVQAKDVEQIEAACNNTGAWKRFLNAAKYYEQTYRDLGYDLWWLDG